MAGRTSARAFFSLVAWFGCWGSPASGQDSMELSERMHVDDTCTGTRFFECALTVRIGQQNLHSLSRQEETVVERIVAVEGGRPSRVLRRYADQRATTQEGSGKGLVTTEGEDVGRIYLLSGEGAGRLVECRNDPSATAEAKGRVQRSLQGLLLPGRAVAPGERWEIPAGVVEQLFHEPGAPDPREARLSCKLLGREEVKGVRGARIAIEVVLVREQPNGLTRTLRLSGDARFELDSGRFLAWELTGTTTLEGTLPDGEGGALPLHGVGPTVLREWREWGKGEIGDETRTLLRKVAVDAREGSGTGDAVYRCGVCGYTQATPGACPTRH
ncbi:MAG: hypothetical protein HYZ53_07220 [Planctomycetes bacterium]|nr:hypothetical protein [Planctomycetota bacterium]